MSKNTDKGNPLGSVIVAWLVIMVVLNIFIFSMRFWYSGPLSQSPVASAEGPNDGTSVESNMDATGFSGKSIADIRAEAYEENCQFMVNAALADESTPLLEKVIELHKHCDYERLSEVFNIEYVHEGLVYDDMGIDFTSSMSNKREANCQFFLKAALADDKGTVLSKVVRLREFCNIWQISDALGIDYKAAVGKASETAN